MSCWEIGKGDVSFWNTNWCGEILHEGFNPGLKVRDGIRDLHNIEHLLTYEQLDKIRIVELAPQEEDKLRFLNTASEKFAMGKYIATLQTDSSLVDWHHRVWNSCIPFRIQAFLWKVYQRALPVDSNVQRRGIQMASKCVCCSEPGRETVDHIFLHSELARSVRQFFAIKLHQQMEVSI